MMTWLLKRSQLPQLILASIVGLVLGIVVIILAGQDFSPRTFAMVAGALVGIIVVFYTKDPKRLLIIAIFVDSISGLDFHLTCNNQYLLTSCGFNVSITSLCLVGLYALWIIDFRRNFNKPLRPSNIGLVGALGACFLGGALLSAINATRIDFVMFQLWNLIVMFLTFFYLVNFIKDRESLTFVIYVLVFTVTIQLVLMELQAFGLISSASSSTGDYARRISGTLYSPNVAGSHLSQLIAVMAACLIIRMPKWRRWAIVVLILMAVHSLIGTESRGAWSSSIIALGVVGIFAFWKKWLDIRTIFIVLLFGAVMFAFSASSITNRLTEDDKGSADSRAPLAEIAFNMIRANPITGVGLNNFGVVFHDYISADQYGAWLYLVHNGWLLIWSETGTIGFAFYVALRVLLVWQGFNLIRQGDPLYGPIALALVASMIGSSIHMLGDVFNARTLNEFVWIQAAIMAAMVSLQKQEQAQAVIVQPIPKPLISPKYMKKAYNFTATGKRSPGV